MSNETIVNEQVKVWAFFDPTAVGQVGIFPIAISWRRRLIKLERLIFASTKRIGQEKIVDLICLGETANFELEYNTSTYNWKLRKVMQKE